MKISEIIVEDQVNEGPIDFMKKLGSGIAGMAKGIGFKTGYAAKAGEIAQQDIVKDMLKNAMADWAAFKAGKGTVNINDASDWAKAYFQDTGEISGKGRKYEITTKPRSVGDKDIYDWLADEINRNFAAGQTYVPPKSAEAPSFVDKLAPIPPDGSIVKSRQGDYKVAGGKWTDPKNNPVTDQNIIQILNDRWEELSSIRGLTPFPSKDIVLNTTNGEYLFGTGTSGKWVQRTDATGATLAAPRTVTDQNEIEQLNKIAAKTP